MKLLMISGDRSVLQGKMGAFWYTLQEMRKHWDRIDIICPHVDDKDVGVSESGQRIEQVEDGADVFFHPSPSGLWWQKHWIVEKGKMLIDSEQHDVMTVHDYPPFYNGLGARSLHKKTDIPYATEIHHIVGYPKAANLKETIGRWMTWWYLKQVTRHAAAIRVVNKTVEEKIVQWGVPEEKIHNISSLYLDAALIKPENRPPVAYDVSFCGRLVANKGLEKVIRAIAQLPTARLLVIGDGPERSRCEKLTKELGIANRVTFLGWLPTQEAVMEAIMTARMFVMNSSSEGGPRVALEAMACGLPIITTAVGVMPEVVQEGMNGYFTTGDSDDLAKKISFLIANDKQAELLGQAATNVLHHYERSQLVKAYADFLKRLT